MIALSKLLRMLSVLAAAGLPAVLLLNDQARAGTAAQLESLVLESGSGLVGFANLPLSPSFNPAILNYEASIPFEHDAVDIVNAVASPGYTAQISVPSSFPAGATTQIVLNIFDDFVFDPFAPPAATYTVNVTRGAPNLTATLSGLEVPGFDISPGFAPLTFSYTATVGFDTASVSITPTAADAESTITVNGTAAASMTPTAPIPLALGENRIVVLVTSGDATVTKGYELLVTRLEKDSDNDKMDDFWEFQNGLNIGVNDSLLDKDLDDLSNLLEYAFGSDPCDPADAARPLLSTDENGFAVISFSQAVTDGSLLYQPEVADPGPAPAWDTDLTNLSGPSQDQVWRDNAGGSGVPPATRWLRVRVTPSS